MIFFKTRFVWVFKSSVEWEHAGVRAARRDVQDAEQAAEGTVRRVDDGQVRLPDGQCPQLLPLQKGERPRCMLVIIALGALII